MGRQANRYTMNPYQRCLTWSHNLRSLFPLPGPWTCLPTRINLGSRCFIPGISTHTNSCKIIACPTARGIFPVGVVCLHQPKDLIPTTSANPSRFSACRIQSENQGCPGNSRSQRLLVTSKLGVEKRRIWRNLAFV